MRFTRRELLKMGAELAVIMGLSEQLSPQLAEALEKMATGRRPVLWLQAQACSGCSISLIDSEAPGPAELMTRYISLLFHHTFSGGSGPMLIDVIDKAIEQGGYVLVVEGSIPEGMPEACLIGEYTMNDLVLRAAKNAHSHYQSGDLRGLWWGSRR